MLKLILSWPVIATILFAGISSVASYISGSWHVLWSILVPVVLAGIEMISTSKFIKKILLKWILPKVEIMFKNKIEKSLRKAEILYKDIIIQGTKEQSRLWIECKKIIGE